MENSENGLISKSLLLKICISSSTIFILFIIILTCMTFTLLVAYASEDDKFGDNEEESYGKVVYNATFTVCGWTFPIPGLSIANINNKNFPSYLGHTGVDVNIGVIGKPIVAVTNGRVIISKAKVNSNGNYVSYGEYVAIQHEDDPSLVSFYCHMSPGTRLVNVGDTVEAGMQLGVVGSTGNSSGPHLHFELRKDGKPINPLPYLQAIVDSDEKESMTDITDSYDGD